MEDITDISWEHLKELADLINSADDTKFYEYVNSLDFDIISKTEVELILDGILITEENVKKHLNILKKFIDYYDQHEEAINNICWRDQFRYDTLKIVYEGIKND